MFVHVPILMLRICDEEAMLKEELEGYTDYRRKFVTACFPG
jgi:protein-S-isoprenylcysteine O-methyltransferase Ste14